MKEKMSRKPQMLEGPEMRKGKYRHKRCLIDEENSKR